MVRGTGEAATRNKGLPALVGRSMLIASILPPNGTLGQHTWDRISSLLLAEADPTMAWLPVLLSVLQA
jgi:hypothetical protein